MRWHHYPAYFFGGAFLANAVPHYVNGVSGHPFQSPFAHPPGEGLSSALVNVPWGFANLVIGYLLLAKVGTFDLRRWRQVIVAGGRGSLDVGDAGACVREISRRAVMIRLPRASCGR